MTGTLGNLLRRKNVRYTLGVSVAQSRLLNRRGYVPNKQPILSTKLPLGCWENMARGETFINNSNTCPTRQLQQSCTYLGVFPIYHCIRVRSHEQIPVLEYFITIIINGSLIPVLTNNCNSTEIEIQITRSMIL